MIQLVGWTPSLYILLVSLLIPSIFLVSFHLVKFKEEFNFKLFEWLHLLLRIRIDLIGKPYKISMFICLFLFSFFIYALPATTFLVLTYCFPLLWDVI